MQTAVAYLVVLFNASNWSSYGIRQTEYPTMEACSKSLTEMKLANERQNSGVAVVAYCAASPKDIGR